MPPIVSDEYKEKKKKEILKSALACFAKKGFEAATIDDIVAHSGISKGAIYNYFKSKDEIYLELMGANTKRILEELTSELNRQNTAYEKMEYLFRVYLDRDLTVKRNIENSVVQFEFKLHSSRSEDLISILNVRRKEYFIPLIAEILLEGQQSGEFVQDFNPELYADIFWSLIDGVSLQIVYGDYPYKPVLTEMKNMYFTKIKA
ncbi:TetR/AcrR family transcriptional regulator [Peribacillus alkalitolerans]|uniref:TetR/AcrR family transcriptional regulator n=1 Tax=Peribacillus alkalitolerans TaxID=1550385 RepID=UPI0013D1AA1F|nr:TetR/AcrR family transcriptional regulator [Peribacillus alkalitolerans]